MTGERQTGGSTRRRTLVGGIVGIGVGTPLLAACGSSGESGGSGGSGGSGSSGGSGGGAASAGTELGPASEVPVGGGKIYEAEKVVVTQPAQGQYKAFTAVCTHQQCLVSKIENDEIDCTCHGSKFSIADGSVVTGPADQPLEELGVSAEGGTITLT